MLQKIKNHLFNFYTKVVSSIAFYPSLIASALFFGAFGLLSFEDNKMTKFLLENASFLVINNADTARSILSTLIGGVISLTVFSFSMVMVLLNQASSNFSPRLLPGLISDKRNQLVLGFYIGAIVYNIIVLISILPDGDQYTLNGFSVLVGIVLGIVCLGLFVYFIHSISTNIQIEHILEGIFSQTEKRLKDLIEMERQEGKLPGQDTTDWQILRSTKTGFFQSVNLDSLLHSSNKFEIDIHVTALKGQYILPDMEIMRFSKKLEESDVELLREAVVYSEGSSLADNYTLGFKQIGEVGVKAMSPGINDPGTAVITIDYLTELFALRLHLDDTEYYKSKDEKHYVEIKTVDFEDLIYQTLAAYRQYCKHDIILMEKIVLMLNYLRSQSLKMDSYAKVIDQQLEILKLDIEGNINNEVDKKKILQMISK